MRKIILLLGILIGCTNNHYHVNPEKVRIVHDTLKVVEYRDTCQYCIYDPQYKVSTIAQANALIQEYRKHPERFWKIVDHYHYGEEMRDSTKK